MQWIKLVHILAVMGWMTGIFAVPRALIYWRRQHQATSNGAQLAVLTIRIYRFSALLGVIAIATGLWMAHALGFPDWTIAKAGAVAILLAHYVYTGILMKQAHAGIFSKSDSFLRIFNETSVLVVIVVLYLVVFQPF